MATVTASYNWASGETVTPAKLNSTAAPTVTINDNEITASKILDGTITLAKLVSTAQQSVVPVGAVQAFAMDSTPSGWLACNGAAVSRTTYAALFSAIGTTYGEGNTTTTFNVPDLRGYFVRGSGTNSDGAVSGTFGAKQADELKSHTHSTGQALNADVGLAAWVTPGPFNYSVVTGATGGTETRPKNIAMLYCIKF
jgi:microcystin-dependent protein